MIRREGVSTTPLDTSELTGNYGFWGAFKNSLRRFEPGEGDMIVEGIGIGYSTQHRRCRGIESAKI
jgi:hypothetical protein